MRYNEPAYKKYIASPKWKAKCEQYWLAKGRWCRACLRKDQLHVHHMSYDHFMHEPLGDLAGLCYDCHKEVHRLHRESGRATDLRTITLRYIKRSQLDRLKRKRL